MFLFFTLILGVLLLPATTGAMTPSPDAAFAPGQATANSRQAQSPTPTKNVPVPPQPTDKPVYEGGFTADVDKGIKDEDNEYSYETILKRTSNFRLDMDFTIKEGAKACSVNFRQNSKGNYQITIDQEKILWMREPGSIPIPIDAEAAFFDPTIPHRLTLIVQGDDFNLWLDDTYLGQFPASELQPNLSRGDILLGGFVELGEPNRKPCVFVNVKVWRLAARG
jgi:hypothetical protein